MNPMLKHFLFSEIKRQFEAPILLENPKVGKMKQLNFFITKEKTFQSVVFDNYNGKSNLTAEETKRFSGMLGIDLNSQMNDLKALFIKIDIPTKSIVIQKNNIDESKNEIITL